MRIRTVLAFSTGLAVGAGVSYLADPDHGPQRRDEARSWAWQQGRAQAANAATGAAGAAISYLEAAVDGFLESSRRESVDLQDFSRS
jgi:hypothetical protein